MSGDSIDVVAPDGRVVGQAHTQARTAAPSRTYQCTFRGCDNYGHRVTVTATPVGSFYVWPQLSCVCPAELQVVEVDGKPVTS